MSARAGGLGFDLTAADTVILYDLDLNPEMDSHVIQRACGLNQQKPVTVYRLITEKTVEENIFHRQNAIKNKIIKQSVEMTSVDEAKEIIKIGSDNIRAQDNIMDFNIDRILEKYERDD